MTKLAVLSFLLLCSTSFSQEMSPPANGRDLIRAMHDHYKGKWYRNLTFRQQSQFYKNGSMERQETWYEALKAPVGLVIKFGSMESGNGIVFRNDTMFVFKNDTMQIQIRRVHDLLVLGFDVYVDDPETTIRRLGDAGYNLDSLSVDKGPSAAATCTPSSLKAKAAAFWTNGATQVMEFCPALMALSITCLGAAR